MTPLSDLLQQGAGNAWLFIPSAILLGALHGLEPGHSKTMMAAFIIAIRGTVTQAVLLGLSATASHTLVVWVVALAGLHFSRSWNAETTEPYFQVASAVIIIAVALWMLWRTRQAQMAEHAHSHDHGHDHGAYDHGHRHDHHGHNAHTDHGAQRAEIGHSVTVDVEVFADGVPPRFRVRFLVGGRPLPAASQDAVWIETVRPDGARQRFTMVDQDDYWESAEEIPEPHEFSALLSASHGRHVHQHAFRFSEPATPAQGMDLGLTGYQDAHELQHAGDIQRRFANRQVTTGQIILFGLTGGLIPCPAAITVLVLCLQLKQVTLGVALVLCFSVGLALTMVSVGATAALGMRHAAKRFSGAFATLARRAPYASGALITLVGLYIGWQGWNALP
ncbi:nickel/cobalt efflux transporter [Nitrospirillum viridazoti]|uniref:Nickel/cobalt efflux system n=1 Tax=Nitrospirillum viridazoti CBAmc TaxID=1441467 RepID=A0A248K0D6_9PROT|nr:nickel/cobalt efflux transporter [Nitrospirillum amazonense]ASG24453.1 nickel/cobalt efflux protein RcnA [Nitrospirillum amazonense CBAmc]TWB33417.1 nickel/cobalt exporter [Nitrospirillum amazonense]